MSIKNPTELTSKIMGLISEKENLQTRINQYELIVEQMKTFLTLSVPGKDTKDSAEDFLLNIDFELESFLAKKRNTELEIAQVLQKTGEK